jgi:hypothetical protein
MKNDSDLKAIMKRQSEIKKEMREISKRFKSSPIEKKQMGSDFNRIGELKEELFLIVDEISK